MYVIIVLKFTDFNPPQVITMFMSASSTLVIRYLIRHITYSDKEKTDIFI